MIVTVPALLVLAAMGYVPVTPHTVEPGRELYPAEAAAAGLEGDVPISLHVDASGALRCVAHGAPALGALRGAGCRLVASRDVFAPGRAKDGSAVPIDIELIVRWRLGADQSQFGGAVPIGRAFWVRRFDQPAGSLLHYEGGQVRMVFDVTEQGRVERCTIEKSSYNLTLDQTACTMLTRRAVLLPALDEAGRPRRTRGTFTVVWGLHSLSHDGTADAAGDGSIEAQ